MPYIRPSDSHRISMLKYLEKDRPITMWFRGKETYELNVQSGTHKTSWPVKTSNQIEKPRYVIIGFQSGRKSERSKNTSLFDHCDITNVKLYLNSQCYPYNDLNLNINKNQYSILYDMYANFQAEYYNKDPEPLLNREEFIQKVPLIVIDCSKQNDTIKNGPVDVRIEFESRTEFPANTTAYCMIIHDRLIQYNPMSGDVKKII